MVKGLYMKKTYLQLSFLAMVIACSFLITDSLNEILLPGTVIFLRTILATITVGVILLCKKIKISWTQLPWGLLLFYGMFQFFIPWVCITFSIHDSSVQSVACLYALFFCALAWMGRSLFLHVDEKQMRRRGYALFAFLLAVGSFQYVMHAGGEIWWVVFAAMSIVLAWEIGKKYFFPDIALPALFGSLLWVTSFSFILMMETSPGTIQYVFVPEIFLQVVFQGVIVSGFGSILLYIWSFQVQKVVLFHFLLVSFVVLFASGFSIWEPLRVICFVSLGVLAIVFYIFTRKEIYS